MADEEAKLHGSSEAQEPLLTDPDVDVTSPSSDTSAIPSSHGRPNVDHEKMAEVGRMLDSAAHKKPQSSEPDFKAGFWSNLKDAEPARHHLEERDISDHHRVDTFPHMHSAYGKQHHHHHHHHRPHRHHSVPSDQPSSSKEETSEVQVEQEPKAEPSVEIRIEECPDEADPPEKTIDLDSQSQKSNQENVNFFLGEDSLNPEATTTTLAFPKHLLYNDVSPLRDMFASATSLATMSNHEEDSINQSSPSHVRFDLWDSNEGMDKPQKEDQEGLKEVRSLDTLTNLPSTQKPKKSHHRHHHHNHKDAMSLSRRRMSGHEINLRDKKRSSKIPVTEDEEAENLNHLDLEDMQSHRFAKTQPVSRRNISTRNHLASVVHISEKGEKKAIVPSKWDHSPHELFVELDELHSGENQEWTWKEKARWIKFEEDLEEGAGRWGRPHVSSLSFHSLLELRKCLEGGVVLLDLEADNLPHIANRIVSKLVLSGNLRPEEQGTVLKALLLKHRHVEGGNFGDTLSRAMSYLNLNRGESPQASPSPIQKRRHSIAAFKIGKESKNIHIDVESPGIVVVPSEEKKDPNLNDIQPAETTDSPVVKDHSALMKRIPAGAEATTVLVGSVENLSSPVMAFVRLAEGRLLGNLTEVPLPVRFVFVLMGPPSINLDYHEIGRSISTLMANPGFHGFAYGAESRDDLLEAMNSFLDDSMVLPPGDWDKETLLPIMDMVRRRLKKRKDDDHKEKKDKDEEIKDIVTTEEDDPLQRTRRLFGGLVKDVKRRYPWYLSDLKDGLNAQCLASFFFIYFACLSPAITFGGLLSEKSDNWMGVTEILLGTCICGVLFALLSAQPLLIVGCTGPILVFEEGLYQICQAIGIDYMSFRLWVGIWIAIVTTIVVMIEGSVLVRYISRFTEEIFTFLISLIFIFETFKKLYLVFQRHPLLEYYPPPGWADCFPDVGNGTDENNTLLSTTYSILMTSLLPTSLPDTWNSSTNADTTATKEDTLVKNQPNTALVSVVLTVGTFIIAWYLKQFRSGKFLGRQVRRALGDFGITIAIIIMVAIDLAFPQTYTEKLFVPDGLSPTDPLKRGWVINPLGMETSLPIYCMLLALIPALLVFILLYMETEITSVIVNKKDRRLKKGSGFHLDLFLIGIFGAISGVLGLPFMVVATVRSITHTSSLSVFSRTHAPGEKPRLVEVKEQRITGLAVHIFIGLSILLSPVLRHVPLAVLFGVFLYMGVASLGGIQLVNRIKLLLMPVKHHPSVGYVRNVRTWKMHIFTLIQLLSIGVLWAVKSTEAALSFPFFLIILIPIRSFGLKYLFTPTEMESLDRTGEDDMKDDSGDEPDFYEQAHMPV